MALTNAERQAAWRKRMAARASGADLGQQARDAVDAATAAMWDYCQRHNLGEIDGIADLAAYRQAFALRPGELKSAVKGVLELANDGIADGETPEFSLLPSEREPLERLRAVLAAVDLEHWAAPTKTRRKRA